MEYVQYEQGYTVQVRHIISTNEDFWYKVKCIISMNRIWSAGKAHHQVLERVRHLLYNTLAWYFLLLMNCTLEKINTNLNKEKFSFFGKNLNQV